MYVKFNQFGSILDAHLLEEVNESPTILEW